MQKTALLIIDIQNAMFDESNPIYDGEQLLKNLQDLINKARTANVPVFFVQHNDEEFKRGTPEWEIHSSISPNEGEAVIQKHTPDSFHETELHEKLKKEQIENLVIAGNQTEYCVDTTSRRAFSLGYTITLVKDAHRTWNSNTLSAKQIIDHHNEVLGNAFATLKETKEIQFSYGQISLN
ncbi:cysteine hydrolase family protein [Cytobacillus solani]|uniref:Isochorismatase n=1 Tax=Cytobacillus solani TaxID=1637975 RepID=A0A0Q3VRN4_9BACI|nr:cysteine hydrolase family protein [Cytobacillus solani]KOP78782.1 isochorismatase [Bacillus sp. FJAT-21945]KQL27538.1 isochorismatase [Cytobacillus solani]USK55244.1 cysteine hydrolase [Cytobacillus solani]